MRSLQPCGNVWRGQFKRSSLVFRVVERICISTAFVCRSLTRALVSGIHTVVKRVVAWHRLGGDLRAFSFVFSGSVRSICSWKHDLFGRYGDAFVVVQRQPLNLLSAEVKPSARAHGTTRPHLFHPCLDPLYTPFPSSRSVIGSIP